MATLDSLKRSLRQVAEDANLSSLTQPLLDAQYSAGFDILTQGIGWTTYEDFIIPQTLRLLGPLFDSRNHVSVLEIGPGPRSLLSYLPRHLRHKVRKYKAFEPNCLFAAQLGESIASRPEKVSIMPCLDSPAEIYRCQFPVEGNNTSRLRTSNNLSDNNEKYDVIIFCHSMYGMKPKHTAIERSLKMLTGATKHPNKRGLLLVFHRDNRALHFGGLLCDQTASFPHGVVSVADNEDELNTFASFVAGFSVQGEMDVANDVRAELRKVCHSLGRRDGSKPGHLIFSSPELMMAFTSCSTWLPRLDDMVPRQQGHRPVKNRQALLHHPVQVVKPTKIEDFEEVFGFSFASGFGLTIIGGGHSGHCLWPNVIAVDMSAFNHVHIHTGVQCGEGYTFGSLVVAEAGCKTGDIIRKTMKVGLTVPLGSKASVGAGSWLQGGIGHLARLHGLTCDAIVGAVILGVENYKQVLCIGNVPIQNQPAGAIRPENEAELLWAIKGAGTNFGIVLSVTFQAYAAPTYRIRSWTMKSDNGLDMQQRINEFDRLVARDLPRKSSGDLYMYWEDGQLRLEVIAFEASTERTASCLATAWSKLTSTWGPGEDRMERGGADELFEAEPCMSGMRSGYDGTKTSSFKRCVFLKDIGEAEVAGGLVAAIEGRPSHLSYLHLLQGGGAVSDIAADATAFGCRDWDFACVITGVWPRDQDGTEAARLATQWVYDVVEDLSALSACRGVYGADLGPGPRDSALATKAFGLNGPRLARLKQAMDPRGVLRYTCPVPRVPIDQKIVILVTGDSCAGKDFCADVWASVISRPNITHHEQLTARVVSISDSTKREYAEAKGADLRRILWDRAYKEQHRPALTAFFKERVREQPNLPEEQFLSVVRGAADVDVLLITGMRDDAPLATFSHLVPHCRLIEVYVEACDKRRRIRKDGKDDGGIIVAPRNSKSSQSSLTYRPSLVFENEMAGAEEAEEFAKGRLLPYLHDDLEKLADMVSMVPDFPRPGIDFRHILNISQQTGGLQLCVSLLQNHFPGDWVMVDSIACCEAGGFVFASALAQEVERPLLLIREAGKLPPPTISVAKNPSYVSSEASGDRVEQRIELELDKVPKGTPRSVLVVDDVLSTGETLCAVLRLLKQAGVGAECVYVMVVAEFPLHKGRELLHRCGFGGTSVQSLLVLGGK